MHVTEVTIQSDNEPRAFLEKATQVVVASCSLILDR